MESRRNTSIVAIPFLGPVRNVLSDATLITINKNLFFIPLNLKCRQIYFDFLSKTFSEKNFAPWFNFSHMITKPLNDLHLVLNVLVVSILTWEGIFPIKFRKLHKKGPVSTFTNTNHVMLCFHRCLSVHRVGVHGRGACVAGGMHGGGCVWWGGMRSRGMCMAGGVHGKGHALQERWQLQRA